MSYIVIVDMREINGSVNAITDDDGNIAQYQEVSGPIIIRDLHEAHPLNVFPWLIVNLDDLTDVDEI